MDADLVERAQWGNLEGQNWAVLVRLSTDEADDNLKDDASGTERRAPTYGRDIRSTQEQERDGREFVKGAPSARRDGPGAPAGCGLAAGPPP
ncbi:hypothetical protein K6I33_004868, partial [Streptomyces sp. UNOB3_S3]|nr:hypothetical protein [Streptomyces sp. UNOB3_S3]